MISNKVSFKYAASFYEFLADEKKIAKVAGELTQVLSVLKENPNLQRAMENPVIKQDAKLNILQEIFKGKISDDVLNFFRLLSERNRINQLYFTLHDFLNIRDDKTGIQRVRLKLAFELPAEQLSVIKNAIEKKIGKQVIFETEIDNSIIGGFVAQFHDTIIDASTKHQLEKLSKQFFMGSAALN